MLKRISEYHSIIKPDFNGGKGDRCICTSAGIVQNISLIFRDLWVGYYGAGRSYPSALTCTMLNCPMLQTPCLTLNLQTRLFLTRGFYAIILR